MYTVTQNCSNISFTGDIHDTTEEFYHERAGNKHKMYTNVHKNPHVVLGHVSLVRVDKIDIVALALSTGRVFFWFFLKNRNHCHSLA